jgi:ureidoacrylate peracid hydrolase
MSQMGPDRTALLVVDMQNAFCHAEGSFTKMGADMQMCIDAIPGCRSLVAGANDANVPVIYAQTHFHFDHSDGGVVINEIMGGVAEAGALVTGTWDAEIVDELKPKVADYVIDKNRFSAFYSTQLESLLASLRIETLVVCGVTTNICVESSVRDAAQRNYRCFVARDAVGEVDRAMHDASLRVLEYGFAKIVDVSDVLDAWATGSASDKGIVQDSPEFLRPRATMASAGRP